MRLFDHLKKDECLELGTLDYLDHPSEEAELDRASVYNADRNRRAYLFWS